MCVFDCHGARIPPCSWLHRGNRNKHLSHWTNSLSFGRDFRRLKQDIHVFHHKGSFKVTKRILQDRTAWFREFTFPPAPQCHSRLLLSRMPAALGTSMTASFSVSRTAPGALRSSLKTQKGQYMKRTMLSPMAAYMYSLRIKSRKIVPAHWFTEKVDTDRN